MTVEGAVKILSAHTDRFDASCVAAVGQNPPKQEERVIEAGVVMPAQQGERGPRRSVLAVLAESAADGYADEALIVWTDSGEQTTYGEMWRRSLMRAARLRASGVVAGDRVCLMSSHGLDYLAYLFGAMILGALATPLSIELRGESLRRPLVLFEPRVVVVDPDLQAVLETVLVAMPDDAAVPDTVLTGEPDDDADQVRWSHDDEPSLSTACLIMSTSGTTGPSKGNVWDHGTIEKWSATYVDHLRYDRTDRIYCCTPMTHANALVTGVMAAIYASCSVALAPRFSVRNFWGEVGRSGSTTANLLGAMIHLLLADPASSAAARASTLRTFLVSSCSASDHLRVRTEWELNPVCAYGLTDFGTLTVSDADGECPPGSCGRAVDGFELRLVDNTDHDIEPGQPGELVVRPQLPSSTPHGYFKMPAETVAARSNLWFHTGDLLRRDADGWYYFAGRVKDALRYRGENVSAYEVESVLMAQPEIVEAAVYSTASDLGEDEIVAAVVPAAPDFDISALVERIAVELPHYAVPRFVRVLDRLPKNGSHRVVKTVLVAAGVEPSTWDRDAAGVVVTRNRPRPITTVMPDPQRKKDGAL